MTINMSKINKITETYILLALAKSMTDQTRMLEKAFVKTKQYNFKLMQHGCENWLREMEKKPSNTKSPTYERDMLVWQKDAEFTEQLTDILHDTCANLREKLNIIFKDVVHNPNDI